MYSKSIGVTFDLRSENRDIVVGRGRLQPAHTGFDLYHDLMFRLLRSPNRVTVSNLLTKREFHASCARKTLVPIVIEQTGRGERSYDIFSRSVHPIVSSAQPL